jgi:hypothetical protein
VVSGLGGLVVRDRGGMGGVAYAVIVLNCFGYEGIDKQGEFLFCWRHSDLCCLLFPLDGRRVFGIDWSSGGWVVSDVDIRF